MAMLPWALRLGAVASVMALLAGVYGYIHHRGYTEGERDAQIVCATEKAAMQKANEDAIKVAGDQLEKSAADLAQKSQEMNDAISALDAAAAANPTGGAACLGADSVRRLQGPKRKR